MLPDTPLSQSQSQDPPSQLRHMHGSVTLATYFQMVILHTLKNLGIESDDQRPVRRPSAWCPALPRAAANHVHVHHLAAFRVWWIGPVLQTETSHATTVSFLSVSVRLKQI
jgi:hypothetical protein